MSPSLYTNLLARSGKNQVWFTWVKNFNVWLCHTLLYLACEEIALEQDNSKERIGLDNPRKNGAQG
jgi:hypothetical protein